jgi:hypothetical protein
VSKLGFRGGGDWEDWRRQRPWRRSGRRGSGGAASAMGGQQAGLVGRRGDG